MVFLSNCAAIAHEMSLPVTREVALFAVGKYLGIFNPGQHFEEVSINFQKGGYIGEALSRVLQGLMMLHIIERNPHADTYRWVDPQRFLWVECAECEGQIYDHDLAETCPHCKTDNWRLP